MASQSVQVLFAIVLIIVFMVVGTAVYNYEYLKSFRLPASTDPRKKIPIFEGIKDIATTNNEAYATTKDLDKKVAPPPNYRDINSSKNQEGGIEFTYTFWLYVKEQPSLGITTVQQHPDEGMTESNIANQTILFVKGTNKLSTYKNICGKPKLDYMVKCPLVKLERNASQLTVEFNTLPSRTDGSEYIEAIKQNSKDQCSDITSDWKTANAHKITLGNINRSDFVNKWILVSVILKDTSPSDPLPIRNKARCMIYINDFLELSTYVDGSLEPSRDNLSTIKTNNGRLHVYPKAEIDINAGSFIPQDTKEIMMGDLTFYNYSIDQATVNSIFTKGPPKYTALSVGAGEDYSNNLQVATGSKTKRTTSP